MEARHVRHAEPCSLHALRDILHKLVQEYIELALGLFLPHILLFFRRRFLDHHARQL